MNEEDVEQLRALLEEHASEVGSARAKAFLSDFRAACTQFALVIPAEQAAAKVVQSLSRNLSFRPSG